MMSGGFLYPPTRPDADIGILFIETSGCLPMCGHGTIGIVSFGLENGFIHPREPGQLTIEVPAGLITVRYQVEEGRVAHVRIRNVSSYLFARDIVLDVDGLGPLTVDIAYGGNYYAIVEPQPGFDGLDGMSARRLVELSRRVRQAAREAVEPVHPLIPTIRGVSHVMWTDAPRAPGADGRNAVFYGESAIDRSPCGTGTSARMAQLTARGRLRAKDSFVHESFIGSRFTGRIEDTAEVGGYEAIVPSIEGSARMTGFNTIWVDREDPFWAGFQVT
jgi:4-hydroxyproline epimerase